MNAEMPMSFLSRLFGGSASAAAAIDHDAMVAAVAARTVQIVDVREPGEYASGHIKGAVNIPLSTFNPDRLTRSRPVVVYCLSGMRSARALQRLQAAGFPDVKNYRPGIGNWKLQGGAMG
jgi:rhodanese-related sulfurtransferase